MGNWSFVIWFIGFLISFLGFIWICVKKGRITLADLGLGFLLSLFSWICVLVGIIVEGDRVIIWRRK